MNKNDTAVEREKAGKMFELNEKYKDFLSVFRNIRSTGRSTSFTAASSERKISTK